MKEIFHCFDSQNYLLLYKTRETEKSFKKKHVFDKKTCFFVKK